jgi:hypothetical protein
MVEKASNSPQYLANLLASDHFLDEMIYFCNVVSQNNTTFQPGKTTFYHVFSYFDFPVLGLINTAGATRHEVNLKDHEGRTALALAAGMGHWLACQQLIELGADVNIRDDIYGQTPLGWACAYGSLEVVKLLLNAGAEVDDQASGRTPLQVAVLHGDRNVCQLLLDRGASVTATEIDSGQTPLSLALSHGNCSLVPLLLEHGADVFTADIATGWTPLHWAVAGGYKRTLKLFLDTIYKTNPDLLDGLPSSSVPSWVSRVMIGLVVGMLCCQSDRPSSAGSHDSKVPGEQPPPAEQPGRQNPKKRSREEQSEDSDKKDNNEPDQPKQKQSRKADPVKFACPFHKRYPDDFSGACVAPGFPDIHRLL